MQVVVGTFATFVIIKSYLSGMGRGKILDYPLNPSTPLDSPFLHQLARTILELIPTKHACIDLCRNKMCHGVTIKKMRLHTQNYLAYKVRAEDDDMQKL